MAWAAPVSWDPDWQAYRDLLEFGTNSRSELDFETAVLQLCDDALFRPV